MVQDGERPAGADRTLYALHPIPLSDVKAVRKHAPSWGTQHVVLVLNNGLTLPPLYFAAGGVKSLFSALKEVRLCSNTVAVCVLHGCCTSWKQKQQESGQPHRWASVVQFYRESIGASLV